MGCLLGRTDTNLCALPPGLTGEECQLKESKCWFNIWATCQMSTKWDGEDSTSYTEWKQQSISQSCTRLLFVFTVLKYLSVTRGHFMPQRMLMKDVNINWVSANELSLLSGCTVISAYALYMQQPGSRPSIKDTGQRENSESKRKLVNVPTHGVDLETLHCIVRHASSVVSLLP